MSTFRAYGFKKLLGEWMVVRRVVRGYKEGKRWADKNGMYRVLVVERTSDGREYCEAHGRAPRLPWSLMMWQMVVPSRLLVYSPDGVLTWKGTVAQLEKVTMVS